MSHSKRSTARSFFTAHEREELTSTWGSRTARLTRDSFLPFGSCQLCLLLARDPVSCGSHGHLFCRECAVSNLLAQNKELKRVRKEAERRTAEEAEDQELEDAEAQARAVRAFETIQAGLSGRHGSGASEKIVGRSNGKGTAEQQVEGAPRGTKRKFELDEDERVRLATEDREKAHLPSFWVPRQMPDHTKGDIKAIKQNPTCPAAERDQAHDFTLKTLVNVKFTEEENTNGSESQTRSCPSCNKALSNSTKAILAKPCGHVLCKPCSDKFQKPPEKSARDKDHQDTVHCYVCQHHVTPGRRSKRKKDAEAGEKENKVDRGLVELSTDGTGFAGGAKSNMVKKHGVAFQC